MLLNILKGEMQRLSGLQVYPKYMMGAVSSGDGVMFESGGV